MPLRYYCSLVQILPCYLLHATKCKQFVAHTNFIIWFLPLQSSLEKLSEWVDNCDIQYAEYFAKSQELLYMLDKTVAEAKAAESDCGVTDDADEVTEE